MNKNKNNKHRFTLLKYYHGAGREPLLRVAPCLRATIRRLEAIRTCCDKAAKADESSYVGLAMAGCSLVIEDINDELCYAIEILRDELPKWR